MGLIHTVTRRPLSDFVDFLWLSDGYAQPHAAERILPTGRMDLIVNLSETPAWGTVVSGARSTSMVLSTAQPLTLLGVGFKPGGGFPFFACPAGELQNLSVPLDVLWGATAHSLREQLLDAPTAHDRFAVLEERLLECLHGRANGPCRHPAIRYALNTFQRGSPATTVAGIVEHTGLSARKLIELFRNQVGLTPKVFSRMCRFRRVIASLGTSTDIDWAATALACGLFRPGAFHSRFSRVCRREPGRLPAAAHSASEPPADPVNFLQSTAATAGSESPRTHHREFVMSTPRISPYLLYADLDSALIWLAKAFGLRERSRNAGADGKAMHAEMALDSDADGLILMGCPGPGYQNPKKLGHVTQYLYIIVDDVDKHFERAAQAGAVVLEKPADQPYGHRRYGVEDPEGHRWFFAQPVRR